MTQHWPNVPQETFSIISPYNMIILHCVHMYRDIFHWGHGRSMGFCVEHKSGSLFTHAMIDRWMFVVYNGLTNRAKAVSYVLNFVWIVNIGCAFGCVFRSTIRRWWARFDWVRKNMDRVTKKISFYEVRWWLCFWSFFSELKVWKFL